jgi:hypothetical protein
MSQYKLHSLWSSVDDEFEMIDLHFFVAEEETCLELTMRRGEALRRLRFTGCRSVRFEPATGGGFGRFPSLYDVTGRGLEGLSVLVADEDGAAADCHPYLWARSVEVLAR